MDYMGVDHHFQYSHVTLLRSNGEEIKRGRVLNTRQDMEEFIGSNGENIRAVIEAGRNSYTMVDLLRDLGVDVRMAHSSDIKLIAKAKIKTDRRDSRVLADLLRTNFIPEIYLRAPENRRRQRILRHRAFYVDVRTQVKNKIRVLLAQQSIEWQKAMGPLVNPFSTKGINKLRSMPLLGTDRDLLDSLLDIYENLQCRIKESDSLVKELSSEMRMAQRIRTIPGFGPFFSVLTAVEIADINRFSSPEKLHCYAGVIPSTHSSGMRSYNGRIIKAGNKWLRWAAVEAVYPAIKSDHRLSVFYKRLAHKKAANIAKVATAKKLLTIVYRVMKDDRDYVVYN